MINTLLNRLYKIERVTKWIGAINLLIFAFWTRFLPDFRGFVEGNDSLHNAFCGMIIICFFVLFSFIIINLKKLTFIETIQFAHLQEVVVFPGIAFKRSSAGEIPRPEHVSIGCVREEIVGLDRPFAVRFVEGVEITGGRGIKNGDVLLLQG